MVEETKTVEDTKKVEETKKCDDPKKEENGEKTPEEPVKEMRTITLTGFGGLKTVKVQKKAEPELGEGEVLIRVKACGLSFQDLMFRQGAIDSPPKCPITLGFECAGEIEKVGEGVEKFKVGDRVVALPECKAWADLVSVPVKYVFPIPADLSFQDAAAITMNYIVAYVLLFELGGLAPGKSVLIHSAGGGVGLAVAQLTKTVPNVKLFGVASKSKHEALASSIEHLLERGTDYPSEVRKVTPEGVDIVLDCIYGEECNRGYNLLKPMGKYILYGSSNVVTGETKSIFSVAKSWWQVDKVSPIKVFDENKTLSGFNLRHFLHHQNGADFIRSIFDKVIDLWKKKSISPVIDSTWALEDVHEGMQKMHERKNVGKIILDPSLEPKPKPATPAKGKKGEKIEKDKSKDEETPNGTSDSKETKEKDKDAKDEKAS